MSSVFMVPPFLFLLFSILSFKEFFRTGRAMRVILPLGDGGVVHLFVIYVYQGAENDPEKTSAH